MKQVKFWLWSHSFGPVYPLPPQWPWICIPVVVVVVVEVVVVGVVVGVVDEAVVGVVVGVAIGVVVDVKTVVRVVRKVAFGEIVPSAITKISLIRDSIIMLSLTPFFVNNEEDVLAKLQWGHFQPKGHFSKPKIILKL